MVTTKSVGFRVLTAALVVGLGLVCTSQADANAPDGTYYGTLPLSYFEDAVGSLPSDLNLPTSITVAFSVRRSGASYRVRNLKNGSVSILRSHSRYTIRGLSPAVPTPYIPGCVSRVISLIGGKTTPGIGLGVETACSSGYWMDVGYVGRVRYSRR